MQVVTRSESGGAQSVVSTLSSELSARGYEVAIASGPEGGGEAWRGLDASIARFEVEGLVRDIAPLNEFRALRALGRLYRNWRPDIVHLHTSKAGALGRLAGGIDGRRIVYTMHGFDQLRVSNRRFLAVDKALRHRCGAVVAVSENDRTAMDAEGYDSLLVRNGCADSRPLRAGDAGIAGRLEALRKSGLPVVMMIARNAAPKRIDLAREAARLMYGRASVAWLGGDPEPEDPPAFHALGSGTGTAAYLGYADMFLLLSDHEGLSMSLIEALSAGLPSVVSATGGLLEVMGLDGAGESAIGLAVKNDADAVAGAIERLCASPGERKRMGMAARDLWSEKYSGTRMAEEYLGIYTRLSEMKAG